jgi:hypothetical protein
MTTAMTRATIAIVRVSMERPYSVSRAVSPDPPSGTPLPLTDGLGASRAGPRRLSPGRGPGVRRRAIDSLLAAASVERQQRRRRYRVPCVGGRWKLTPLRRLRIDPPGHCSAASTITTRASSRTSASASGRRRAERMIPADEDVLRAHVRVSQACHVRPDAWRVGDRELMDELDRERIARSSRSLLDGLGEPVAGVIRAARRRHAPALPVAVRLEIPDGARRLPVYVRPIKWFGTRRERLKNRP